jgi:CheY-like chemotaxis protein
MTRESQTGTILLVDDNVDIRELGERILASAGYNVISAADGAEGLRFYEEHHSSIGLLITDVLMPNLNGLELADRVLQIDSELPVLFISGDAWSSFRGLECLAKPFRAA